MERHRRGKLQVKQVAKEETSTSARGGVQNEIEHDIFVNRIEYMDPTLTSQLLAELYNMLHIRSIRITLYHPQTNELVECFNQTLQGNVEKSSQGGLFAVANLESWLQVATPTTIAQSDRL